MPPSRSNVRVEVTFKNPVVFAGESLNAIITFRNILSEGDGGEAAVGGTGITSPSTSSSGVNSFQGVGHQRHMSTIDARSLEKPSRHHKNNGRSADLTNGNENPNDRAIEPDGQDNGTESSSGMGSVSGTGTEESSALASQDEISSKQGKNRMGFDDDDESWLSGRRLSMQLANSFREFYSGTSNSSSGAITRPSSGLSRSASTVTRGTSRLAGGSGGSGVSNSSTRLASNRTLRNIITSRTVIPPTNLLMGFAQLQGYFQVDESIVSAEFFEPVKTQGIVVGRHGLEYRSGRGETGLLRGLTSGLGSFGGFGSFFKNDNPNNSGQNTHSTSNNGSSERDINGPSDIPIFSTPQSLLFVDLKLAPGEVKSFSYQLNIPKTLPPSCRGKAISIYYNLVIGTQKLTSRGSPEPKIILVPFRVFPFVDSSGNQPSHKLTQPIVLKSDEAMITQLNERRPSVKSFEQLEQKQRSSNTSHDSPSFKKSKDEFTNYLDDLLTNGLPSTAAETLPNDIKVGEESTRLLRHRSSLQAVGGQDEYTARENIDFFIKYYQQIQAQQIQSQSQQQKNNSTLQIPNSELPNLEPLSNSPTPPSPSPHPHSTHKVSFDINLKGHRIAFIYLSRPVYRIGEDIILVFDFTSSLLNCRHITATLETTEKIGPNVSLKSDQEVTSLTRRIFSHTAISTFACSKTSLQFTIPSTGTPQFSTSDISLGWSVKIDFVTSSPRISKDQQSLLKSVSGPTTSSSVFIARSALPSESFSCRIPIQVYPTNQDIKALLDHHSGMMNRRWVI